jgi:hypothetical protein
MGWYTMSYYTKYVLILFKFTKHFILLLLKLSGLEEDSRVPKHGFVQGTNTSSVGPAYDSPVENYCLK